MKRIAFALVLGLSMFAAGPPHPNRYCAKMKGGRLVVMHKGKELKSNAILSNGMQIKTDCTVIRKDGSRTMLREGECMDVNGNVTEERINK